MIFLTHVTGPEKLLRQSSDLGSSARPDRYSEGDGGDAIEAHEWKCVRTINGNFSQPNRPSLGNVSIFILLSKAVARSFLVAACLRFHFCVQI
jgi:hypothetical protein